MCSVPTICCLISAALANNTSGFYNITTTSSYSMGSSLKGLFLKSLVLQTKVYWPMLPGKSVMPGVKAWAVSVSRECPVCGHCPVVDSAILRNSAQLHHSHSSHSTTTLNSTTCSFRPVCNCHLQTGKQPNKEIHRRICSYVPGGKYSDEWKKCHNKKLHQFNAMIRWKL